MAEVGVFVHWRRYCYGAGRSVYLDGQDPWADQEEILRFVTHQAYNSHCDYSAICDMLSAIQVEHLRAGLPDPLTDKPLAGISMKDIAEMRQIEHGPEDCGTSFNPRRTGFPVGGGGSHAGGAQGQKPGARGGSPRGSVRTEAASGDAPQNHGKSEGKPPDLSHQAFAAHGLWAPSTL